MKKLLFKYLLASLILVGAFGKAQAQLSITENKNGLTSPSSIYGGQSIAVVGVSLIDAAGSTFTKLTFNCNQVISNYFTMSVVRITNANAAYVAGTAPISGATFAVSGAGSTILTATLPTQTLNSTGYSYFLVVTFNIGGPDPTPSPVSFNFNLTQVGTTTISTITGPTYTWDNPAIVTVSGNNVPANNGIEVNDIYYTQQGICVYGFSITVSNSKALITQVALSAMLSDPATAFFTASDVYVVENNGTDFHSGTNTPISTTNSVGVPNNIVNLNFDTPLDFTPPSGGSITRNFFVYINFNSNFKTYPNAVTFYLDPHAIAYNEISGGAAFTNQTVNPPQSTLTGYPIAFATPTISYTGQNVVGTGTGGNGISRTTLTFGQTDRVMYGFSVSNTGSQTTLTTVSLNTTTPIAVYFQNFRVYRSTSSTFISGTTDVPANLVSCTITAGTGASTAFTLKALTEVLPFNQTVYYFIMADWTVKDVTAPANMQFTLDATNKIKVNSGANIGYTTTDGQQFSLGVPIYDWTGATSGAWATPGNWLKNGAPAGTVPGGTSTGSNRDVVRIGVISYTGNNTTIKIAAATTIGSLEIGSLGSTASTASPVILDLNNFTLKLNFGLVVDAAAVLTLNSSAAGSSAALNISAASTSTVASTGLIKFGSSNPVTVVNGTGTFTLLSDANGTGSIASIPSNSKFTGTYIVQRYFTGGSPSNRGWRLMSSPVNNSTTIPMSASATYNFASLKTNLFITGTGGNDNGFDQPASYGANGATILFYTTSNSLFVSPTTFLPAPGPTAGVGSGFYFYFRGDNVHNISQKLIRSPIDNTFAVPESVVGLQSGTLNQQGFTYNLSNAGTGYNLVGNPYPSNITVVASALTGTTPFVYTFAPGSNSITAKDVSAGVTIQSGQGFYLKSNSSTGSIAFTESLKTTNAGSIAFNTVLPDPAITLKMIQDTANYDVAQLRFSDVYNKNYKDTEDADDLNANGQTVLFGAMTADKHVVSIASQPLNKQSTSVYLSVDDKTTGVYKIKKMDLSSIPDYYDVWLLDHYLKDSLDIRNNDTYQFKLDKKVAASYGNSRFEVNIRKKLLPPYSLVSFSGKHANNSNILKWNTVNEFTYVTFDVQYSADNKNFNTIRTMQSLGSGSYDLTDVGATAGYYRLKQTDLEGIVKYSAIVIITSTDKGSGIFSVYPNPTSDVLQFTTNEAIKTTVNLKIYNNIGALVKSATFNTSTGKMDVSSLMAGFYGVELIDNNNNKTIASAKFIKQ